MRFSVNLGLVICLFYTFPTVLGSAQKTFKFYEDVTKLAQVWTGAVQAFMDSFNSYNQSLGLETYVNVSDFEDPLLEVAHNQSLKILRQATDAIGSLSSLISKYSDAFRGILFDEQKDIETRFGVLLEELSAQTGVLGKSCETLYKDNITNAAAQFTESIKSCAESVVAASPQPFDTIEAFVSLTIAAVDMTEVPIPSALQCKLNVTKAATTKYAELQVLVSECLLKEPSKSSGAA